MDQMNKKPYHKPEVEALGLHPFTTFLQTLSAPDEGIHDGGEGNDDDDPSAKNRTDGWGDLW